MTVVLPTLAVKCPAGEPIAEGQQGRACHCRIVDHVFTERQDPVTVDVACGGNYTLCSVFRDDRERDWARRKAVLDEADAPITPDWEALERAGLLGEGDRDDVAEQVRARVEAQRA